MVTYKQKIRGIMSTTEDSLKAERLQKLNNFIEAGINPYPAVGKRTVVNADVAADFKSLEGKKVSVVGRIMSMRAHGRIMFFSIQDESGSIQILFKEDNFGKPKYKFLKNFDLGDFIEVSGTVFKTNTGQVTVEAKKYTLLSKALLPIPEQFHGLKDVETRYRKRYLDFLINHDSKEKMYLRAKTVKATRDFLEDNGFLEMQFPILEAEATGAAARPFKTHYNAYDNEVFLRICIGELWQKRAIVGGFERTFEIGKAFRNEGVDAQHNPEFMMCEFYMAYADYQIMMKFVEKMIVSIVKSVKGKTKISYQGQEIDFKAPYPVFSFKELLQKFAKLDIDKFPTKEKLGAELKKRKFDFNKDASRGTLIDEYYKETVRPNIVSPIFLVDHPVDISPLAKPSATDPSVAQRFQLVVCGAELVNAYSELNDPQLQAQRLTEQAQMRKEGDEESQTIDTDYIEAMEYGMPPISGTGVGIERLIMLLTDSAHLREATPFPFMRPVKESKAKGQKPKVAPKKK
jgi:lysyl-tRNA synthetase, class II